MEKENLENNYFNRKVIEMSVTAKFVRTLAPAGSTVNFTAITGNSHRYFWISTELIKSMLEKDIRVFERLKENTEEGVKDTELTLENYAEENTNCVKFDEDSNDIVIKDYELKRSEELQETHEEFLENIGLEIKSELDKKIEKYNKKHPSTEITASGEQMTEEDGEL